MPTLKAEKLEWTYNGYLAFAFAPAPTPVAPVVPVAAPAPVFAPAPVQPEAPPIFRAMALTEANVEAKRKSDFVLNIVLGIIIVAQGMFFCYMWLV